MGRVFDVGIIRPKSRKLDLVHITQPHQHVGHPKLNNGIGFDCLRVWSFACNFASKSSNNVNAGEKECTMSSWNSKIKALIKEGKGRLTLQFYEDMQFEAVLPDRDTFVSMLSVCASYSFVNQGKRFHACLINTSLRSDITIGNILINLYGKSGSLEYAIWIFDDMVEKNVVTWSTLIAAYVHNDLWDAPFGFLDQMLFEGLLPDSYTFTGLISACAGLMALAAGVILHVRILGLGMEETVVLGNGLIHMYGKCDAVESARKVFDLMPSKNVASWNAVIGVYAQHGYATESLLLLSAMRQEGVPPDKITFTRTLQACNEELDFSDCEDLHDLVLQSSFCSDVSVGNALVKMYAKQGRMENALHVFQEMVEHDVVSWNALMAGLVQVGQGNEALQLHDRMQQQGILHDKATISSALSACGLTIAGNRGRQLHSIISNNELGLDIVVTNSVINMYVKCDDIVSAQAMFDEMPERDLFSWNAMLAGHAQPQHSSKAMELFEEMQVQAVLPDKITLLSTISAYSCMGTLADCHRLHARILGCGYEAHILIQNALVDMYGMHDGLENACALFEEIQERDMVSWNAFISAHRRQGKNTAQLFHNMLCEAVLPGKVTFVLLLSSYAGFGSGALVEGVQLHARLSATVLEEDVAVSNALISMYSSCGKIDVARKIFDEMDDCDVTSWNSMIASYVHIGDEEEAYHLFESMQLKREFPDQFTFATILSVCAGKVGLERGQMLHIDIVMRGFESNVCVANAVLSMYAKCGDLISARKVFDGTRARNLVTWNAIIAAYAQHGKCKDACVLFEEMKRACILPNHLTFIILLSACNHAGLVDEGCQYFLSMYRDYKVTPDVEHYDCLIGLLGRAGRLDEAEGLLKNMPFEPTSLSFMSLLGASKVQADVERGQRTAECVSILDPGNAVPYIVLSQLRFLSSISLKSLTEI